MKYKLVYSFLLWLLMSGAVHAQAGIDTLKQMAINKTDINGKPHGMWLNKKPPQMGEIGYTEFGHYQHGRRSGLWYKMDEEGQLVAIENYRNNALDGEVKYFENGKLASVGHYRGLNPDVVIDTIIVENPVTGAQTLTPVSSDRGSLRHGIWRFYNTENGRLMREEDYQVDELVFSKDFKMTRQDSLYYIQKAAKLPHNRKVPPKLPAGKKNTSYLNY